MQENREGTKDQKAGKVHTGKTITTITGLGFGSAA